jgi:hypothetical protein
VEQPEFAERLRAIAATDDSLRPFVCDGSPLDCDAFIVGANPATSVPFWPYWHDTTGFDRRSWLQDYEQIRVATAKPPRSRTRDQIDRVVASAAPTKCLETNAYASPSSAIADLKNASRSTALITFLVDAIRPKVILAHGREAQAAIDNVDVGAAMVLRSRHLSRVSYATAEDLGRQIRKSATVEGVHHEVE